mmetsp:Transcript_104512/g.337065  ORF Transcript_104512/g.337065 Transcript_104512/m.337065 type:complete len:423 (-) Transcript_104512:242-1510(-)
MFSSGGQEAHFCRADSAKVGPMAMKTRRTPPSLSFAHSVSMMWLLTGMPSVSTTTTGCTPCRPPRSSISPASARACPVPVLDLSHAISSSFFSRASLSAVSSSTASASVAKFRAPSRTASSLSSMRAATAFAKACASLKPWSAVLPEESRAKTTSMRAAHFCAFASSQACLLQATVCRRSAASCGGQEPSPRAGRCTCRKRTRWPALQALLQPDHSDQGSSAQSSSQGWALQLFSCIVSMAGRPPFCASWRTCRVLVFVPPPQAREHCDQGPQRLMALSTGQGLALHLRVLKRAGHAWSFSGVKMTSRVMFCVPPSPPQSSEQGPTVQAVTWQSPRKPELSSGRAAGTSSCQSFLALHILSERSPTRRLHSCRLRVASSVTSRTCTRRSRRMASSSAFSVREFASWMVPSSVSRFSALICSA